MSRVAVIGSINQDIVVRVPHLPRPGETVSDGTLARHAGGKGANQAVAAARAGARVDMIGVVGTDDAGQALTSTLTAAGVGTSYVRQVTATPTGVALIAVDTSGANAIALAPGANGRVEPDEAREAVQSLAPDVVLGQLETPLDSIRAALGAAGSSAWRILNAAPAPSDAAVPYEVVDLLVVNEIEAGALLGERVTADTAGDAAAALARRAARGCAVTLGPAGVVAAVDGRLHVRSAHLVDVVDTTGAGDAFSGALAAALAAGRSVESAIDWANAAGALATTKPGAQPSMPDAEAIRRLLETALA